MPDSGDARLGVALLTSMIASAAAVLVGHGVRRLLVGPAETSEADGDVVPVFVDLRNAALQYRPIGGPGEPYPDWVRALKGKSGVYVIRETQRDGKRPIVYVGQSRTGRLYQTLTRHFQMWRRSKKFWAGQYTGIGHDPGLTYARERVTVAVRVLPSDRALDEEARLIERLRPRDNLIGQPDEEIPF